MGQEGKKRKKSSVPREKPNLKRLEAIVFGGGFDLGEECGDDAEEEEGPEDDHELNKAEAAATVASPVARTRRRKRRRVQEPGDDVPEEDPALSNRPAWVDPDDASLQVNLDARKRTKKLRQNDDEVQVAGDEYEKRLREHFRKLHGSATWADSSQAATGANAAEFSDEDDAGVEAVPTSASALLEKGRGGRLRPTDIDVQRLREAAIAPPGEKGPASIQALHFHPNSELLLTAGRDKTLRLFAVDGEENPKVASHFFQNFPIMGAKFTPSGDQVVMTTLDQRMMGLDVKTGKSFKVRAFDSQASRRLVGPFMGPSLADAGTRTSEMYAVLGDAGAVLLCDVRTHMPVRTLRMSSLGAAAAFSYDREVLYTADQEAHIYEWDIGKGRCKHKTKDAHAARVTSLALSRTTPQAPRPMLAVGTTSGNIDLFDAGGPKRSQTPCNSIGNLTTRISGVQFHSEGELLVGFSHFKKDHLRLVHAGTATVYRNWPPNRAPLGKVSAFDFALRDGLMAVGNERGRVLLYRLNHYQGLQKR